LSEISIEIVTNFDKRILKTLESIRSQTFQDFDVVVATDSPELKDIVKNYNAKIVIVEKSGTLYRRIEAHRNSNGRKSLLLEASRYLDKNCLFEINKHKEDMIIVQERDINDNYIARIQNIERSLNASKLSAISPESLILEPRVYSKGLLDHVYKKAELIKLDILKSIQYGDLDIIYYESYQVTYNIGIINQPIIYHYTDENIKELIRKYYSYGKSNKLLKYTPYNGKFNAKNHLRPNYGLKNNIPVYLLWSIKAISFALGSI
jgi:hypothetical protein